MKTTKYATYQNNAPTASMIPQPELADINHKTMDPELATNLSPDSDDDTFWANIPDEEQINDIENQQRPEGWKMGSFSALKKVVADAKGAASNKVVRFIKKHLRGTKLIFVVGQSGTGKSTLLSEISGQSLHIGKYHMSGTKNHQVCPAIIDGEQYIFVDTAGLGAADTDDMENFHDIIACLDALGSILTVSGILFVYGGNQDRMMKHDFTTIQWIKCFCGPEFYKYITIVTNKWDALSEDDFEEAWEHKLPVLLEDTRLADILNPSLIDGNRYAGGDVYHHGVVQAQGDLSGIPVERLSLRRRSSERSEMIRAMITSRYKEAPTTKLQVVREMASGCPWYQTEAAKVLVNNPMHISLKIQDDLIQVICSDAAPQLPTVQTNQQQSSSKNIESAVVLHKDAVLRRTRAPFESYQPRRSWASLIFKWLKIAKDIVLHFLTH